MSGSSCDHGSFHRAYTENEIVKKNPFALVNPTCVGQLLKIGFKGGACVSPRHPTRSRHLRDGEHGGDPDSVKFCHKLGLIYVSCSPYRVFFARLAAALAAIKEKRANAKAANTKKINNPPPT